jgi:hypothetical protein
VGAASANDGGWGWHMNVVIILHVVTPIILAVLLNIIVWWCEMEGLVGQQVRTMGVHDGVVITCVWCGFGRGSKFE